MNYSKKEVKANAEKLKGKRAKKNTKAGILTLKAVLTIVLAVILGCIVFFGIYSATLISKLPDIKDVDITPNGYMTTVLDKDGEQIEKLASSGANRSYVKLENIPKDVQHAFVAIEDERFYTHHGIDVKGIFRAGFTFISSAGQSAQGASTITQQLLKNNYFTTWTSESTKLDKINRKIQEQYLALQLEKVTSKDTILENYLNTINLGQNTLGVEAASKRYFNKSVKDLNVSEAATIAAITQNPSKYNPISHPEDNAKRRKSVLDKMKKQGYINDATYEEAMADDVYERISTLNASSDVTRSTSYFVDALSEQVAEDLQEQLGYSETEAYQLLYSGGLTINSTQDTKIQKIAEKEVNDTSNYGFEKYSFSYRLTVNKADGTTKNYSDQTMLYYYQSKNKSYTIDFSSKEAAQEAIDKYKADIMEEGDTIAEGGETLSFTLQPQAAMTIIDQSTGHVVGLVGGRGEKLASRSLNRATGITRQPGSTFKVVSAYAAALDAGGMSLATTQDDSPMTYANGTPLSNYDDRYRGFTTIREAITHSINVMAVKTLTEVGTGLGYQYVENLGITTLIPGDNNQALALGGITNGVTNLELCGAYATIANKGYYNKPVFYTTVTDHSGNVILDTRDNESKQVLKETTAWLLTMAMQDVMTQGTGTPANFDGVAVAGKSGTTTKNRDTVFAGYTPYYTAVIWGGYDDNAVQGTTSYSKAIWRKVMSQIHSGLAYKGFEMPQGIVAVEVCKKSGKLPIAGVCDCDPRGSMIITEYFDEENVPTETCDRHVRATICNQSHMLATSRCSLSGVSSGVFILGATPGNEDSAVGLYSYEYCTVHGGSGTAQISQPGSNNIDVEVTGGLFPWLNR